MALTNKQTKDNPNPQIDEGDELYGEGKNRVYEHTTLARGSKADRKHIKVYSSCD